MPLRVSSGWNQRPRDMANFCRWMTRNLDGRFTNWQIVNLRAKPEELHDAPILYMAGSESFNLPKEDVEKLKLFVEQGGLILGNADCGNIEMTFPYFVNKAAPVSGVQSLMDYEVTFVGGIEKGRYTFTMKVVVPVTSLCPCSKGISDYGAHNQRSHVTVTARTRGR